MNKNSKQPERSRCAHIIEKTRNRKKKVKTAVKRRLKRTQTRRSKEKRVKREKEMFRLLFFVFNREGQRTMPIYKIKARIHH